jgi:hypothetical protein
LVPEHPAYWAVPEDASAAVELLVADGQVEYEHNLSRAAGGLFSGPAVQVVAAEAAPAARPFQRKAPR